MSNATTVDAVTPAPLRELLYAVRDRVATITFNRPDKLNAWTRTMEEDLRVAFAAANADDEVRAIVLTGAGRGFCPGADASALARAAAGGAPAEPLPTGEGDFEQRYSYLMSGDKPMIAAINGAASGVGLCFALFCDLRFVAEGARLSMPFSRRGLIAEHGSAWLLPRLIGPMHAADLLLSGRTFDASEAAAMGLAKLLPAEGFLEAVQQRASELANLSSPRSMRIIKQQLRQTFTVSLADATRLADAETQRCRTTADFMEGVASMYEKRPPKFTGQ